MNEKAKYTEVSEEQNKRIQEIRNLFSNAYDSIEKTCQPSRETSLAITKLEEAQFWAIKGITREKNQPKEDAKIKLTDETGYILISEIIKAHVAEHNQNREVMLRCEQALQILDMLKEES